MEKRKVFILVGSLCLILMLAVLPLMTACAKPAPAPAPTPAPAPAPAPAPKPPAAPIELKLTTFLPMHVTSVSGAKILADKVNTRSKGQLTIKILGGPEVMSGRDQPAAAVKGIIDIACVPTSYFPDLVPAADIISLSKFRKAEDERKPKGIYDAMQELCNKAGLYLIGRESGINPDFFYNITNKKVVTPYDLLGQKIGASIPKWKNAWKELGVAFSVVPAAECYTAMERGVLDGYNYPLENHVDMGLHEVTKYCIDHGFFCDNVVLIMNIKTWNSLSPDLQKLIKDAQIELEREQEAAFAKIADGARKKMLDAKVGFIKFSPADAAWYLNVFYKNELAEQKEKFPDVAPRLAELLGW